MTRLLPPIHTERHNGTTYLALERHDAPLCYARILCPGGQAWNGLHGAAALQLSGDLFNEGPASLTPRAWHRRSDRECIDLHVSAGERHWTASADALSEDLLLSLDELEEWIGAPAMPRSEWKPLVKAARAQAREDWSQPMQVLGRLAYRQALGPAHPNARHVDESALKRARYVDAAELGRMAFAQREGAFALLGGDAGAASGIARLKKVMAALPKGEPPPSEPDPRPSRNRVWLMDHPSLNQAYFALTRPGVKAGDPDRIALRLANYALGGGGFSSRLTLRVREELGQTYAIASRLRASATAHPFTISSFTSAEQLGAVLRLIHEVCRNVSEAGFTADELNDARAHLYGSMPIKLIHPMAILEFVQRGLDSGLSLDDLEADWKGIPEVPNAEVHAAARRFLGETRFHLAVIGPAAKLRDVLSKYGEAKVLPFKTSPSDWPTD